MIVATAGHIDHGKTALVKALTGVDTDRLPEEKARGISIDLGFAYWREPRGRLVGFVDVPGHERFVHNMLAGVCAIDYVLLLVAADDGVMPQTREHLDIMHLLDIQKGALVVTKADRVETTRVRQVEQEVRELVASTSLAQAPLLVTSSATGQGVRELSDLLAAAAQSTQRHRAGGRRFRFAIDRAFSVVGSGTVVTGTVYDGTLKVGDRVVVSPGDVPARVRGLQKAHERADCVEAGERCALNLAGVELAQVRRGDWVMDPALHGPTEALDVEVCVLPGGQPLQHYTPVHLHLGTQDVSARVLLRRGATVEPGGSAFARMVASRPVSALHGDRFILRDQSAQRTLAGGMVLDAFPPTRRAPVRLFEQRMQALQLGPAAALAALANANPVGEDAAVFCRNFNLGTEALQRALAKSDLVLLAPGDGAARIATAARAQAVLRRNERSTEVESPEHLRLWQLAQAVLARAGGAALGVSAIADEAGVKEAVLRDVLHRRAATGDTVRLGGEKFLLRSALDHYSEVARGLALTVADGRFTAAMFRDAAGVGRTFAIQLLEAMDRLGVTRRIGEARVILACPLSKGVIAAVDHE